MVKGISRQVIVVQAPEPKMFEQAIFILKDEALGKEGITEDVLLKEANRLLSASRPQSHKGNFIAGPVWACGGALITGIVWLLSVLI